jgi:pimeloyl-ACP methyl ester carboxylesterase
VRYNFDDVLECWQQITAKVGLVMATDSTFYKRFSQFGRLDESKRVLNIADTDYFEIENCGHMLHIEKPKLTADAILAFLKGS